MSQDDLQRPLTAIEAAELVMACSKSLTPAGMLLLRRALFQADRRADHAAVWRAACLACAQAAMFRRYNRETGESAALCVDLANEFTQLADSPPTEAHQ